jgi:uroporphyrinogen-III decarboxylase
LIPCEAMGLPLVFEEPGGPKMPAPLRCKADIDHLIIPDPEASMGFVMDLLRQLKTTVLAQDTPPALIWLCGRTVDFGQLHDRRGYVSQFYSS